MTTLLNPESNSPASWRPRQHLEVVVDQLVAIEAWNAARAATGPVREEREAAARSREARLDLARRQDVMRRQHEALLERAERQLAESGRLLQTALAPRAVLAHRNEWFRGKIANELGARGIEVLAQVDNGADAVGVAVAEQPDLLLVEDKLAMVNGDQVIRQVRMFSPATFAVAHVAYDDEAGPLLEAGARAAYTRRQPPAVVAEQMATLVGG